MEENKEKEIDLMEIIHSLWSGRKKIIRWGIYGAIAGLIIGFSIPKEYTSSVKVAPEGSTGKSGSMSGLAAMVGLGGSVSVDGIGVTLYPSIISSTPFLMEFKDIQVTMEDGTVMPMSEYILEEQKSPWWSYIFALPGQAISGMLSLFKSDDGQIETFDNSPRLQDKYREAMTKRITSALDDKAGTFTIIANFQDPVVATEVADSALVKLQRYMNDYKTAKTRSNLASNQKMLEEARNNYYLADEAYSEAYDRNQNISLKSASIKLERLKDERNMAYQLYTQLATQVETDRIKLQEVSTIATVIEPVNFPVRASSPNKPLTLIAFAFLGGLIPVGRIVFGVINQK